jgi:nucleotide-binding universal stress UspA family protein
MIESGGVKVILVGDDGSAGAERAIVFAATLASQLDAEVVLVKAYSPLDELGTAEPPVDFKALRDRERERLDTERCKQFNDAGVRSRVLLIENPDAIGVLARTAGEVEADLVVVGSHGQSGWRGRILGSVATKLPHDLSCPIAIVPAPRTGSD